MKKMPTDDTKRPFGSNSGIVTCPTCEKTSEYKNDTVHLMQGNYGNGHQLVWCPDGHITLIRFENRKEIIEFTYIMGHTC